MGLVLLVVLGIIVIIVLNILKAQGVSLPGVGPRACQQRMRLEKLARYDQRQAACLPIVDAPAARRPHTNTRPVPCMPLLAEPAAAAVGTPGRVVRPRRLALWFPCPLVCCVHHRAY